MDLKYQKQLFTFEKIKAPRPQDKIYGIEGGNPEAINRCCQTDFRESETQTSPWMPPCRVWQNTTPEVLTLECLSFANGLQITTHDVEVLQRLRKKRQWDKYLAHIHDPANIEFRKKIINEFEKNEWEFKEKEIDEVNKLRMKLAEKELLEQRDIVQERIDYRVKKARDKMEMEKRVKLPKIATQCQREIRRTRRIKSNKLSIIDRFTHKSSNMYAPLARFGKNPADKHEKLCVDPHPKEVKDIFHALYKNISTTPSPQPRRSNLKKHCCRRMKYYYIPEEVPLKQIEHYDRLNKKVEKILTQPLAPVLGESDDEEQETLKNVVLLQSLIKGRAVQSMVLRHLKSHRDLVQELKSTIGLNPRDEEKKLKMRKDILMGIRDYNLSKRKKGKIIGILEKLEGHTISSLLDFTSKSLIRLEDEKIVHLLALAAEKDRWARESAEGGRRQQEEIRQRQYEEIYKQIFQMHEITSDLILEDIAEKQVKDTSEAIATIWAERNVEYIEDHVDLSHLEEFEKIEHKIKMSHQYLMDEEEKKKIQDQQKAQRSALRDYAKTIIYHKRHESLRGDIVLGGTAISLSEELYCKDSEEDEWDKPQDKVLKKTPNIQKAGGLEKITIFEDLCVETSTKVKENENDGDDKEEEKEENKVIKRVPDYKQKKVTHESIKKNTIRQNKLKKDKKFDQLTQSSIDYMTSSCSTSEMSETSSSDVSFLSSVSVLDEEGINIVKYSHDAGTSDKVGSPVEGYEPRQKEMTIKGRQTIERRTKKKEREESKIKSKILAQKLLDQIMDRANEIARKFQDLREVGKHTPVTIGQADALMHAYKIVSRELLKRSAFPSDNMLREHLKIWLDVVLHEAEKRVSELFDALLANRAVLSVAPKEVEQIKKVEEDEKLIEITLPSEERINLIPEASSGAHIFKGSPIWCPDMTETEKVKIRKLTIKPISPVKEKIFTEEELSRLVYTGILDEGNQTYLPDETHVKKLRTVVKSRRHPSDDAQDTAEH